MTQLLVIGFLKAIRGKAYLKINLLVKTPLHRRSMEVRRSGVWAPDHPCYLKSRVPPPRFSPCATLILSCLGTYFVMKGLNDFRYYNWSSFGV